MKKIITAIAIIFIAACARAQKDTSRTKYEYYPESNVYYNDQAQTYWYHDSASNKWLNTARLPANYSVGEKSKKNSFYYNGGNVWKGNAGHKKLYGKKSKSVKPNE